MAEPCLLIGDLGGTNARFALADSSGEGFVNLVSLPAANYDGPEAAIRDYLSHGSCDWPDVICLAVAAPVTAQRGQFTNLDWNISAVELSGVLDVPVVRLLNDFEAIAWAIPGLKAQHLQQIGPLPPKSLSKGDYTVAVLGPGTGLGSAGLVRRAGKVFPIASEFQHGGFAPEARRQAEVLEVIRQRFDRVSTERLACGSGLENIFWALSRLRDESRRHADVAEIFRLALEVEDPLAVEAVQLFYEVLGQAAGDLALAFLALEGIYIAGGIAMRYPEQLVASPVRHGFEDKGRYRPMMERIPTALILHPEPGLLGAAQCARSFKKRGRIRPSG